MSFRSPFTATGGALLGWTSASVPLARLTANGDRLTIAVRLLGSYEFSPDQVVDLERYVMIRGFAHGVRVRHCRADYPERVVFWTRGNPDAILQGILDAEFAPKGSVDAVPARRGPALRWSAIIAAVVLWNLLFMLPNFVEKGGSKGQFSGLALFPLVTALVACIVFFKSPAIQRLALKPGRDIGEIRPFLRLLLFILSVLLVLFSVIIACGGFAAHH